MPARPAEGRNYGHDGEGNVTSRTRISTSYASDYEVDYSWDFRNRLTDAYFYDNSHVLTKQVHDVYDVFDQLIEQDVQNFGSGAGTQIVHHVWDGDGIVLDFNGQNQLTERYLNGPNTSATDSAFSTLAEEQLTSLTSPGTVTFNLLDNLGSVRNVVDANGALQDHIDYDVFGVVAHETNPAIHDLTGFAGGLPAPNTGLVLFGHRWYDAANAVWMSSDPLGFGGGDANLQRYVGNDPANETDPSGLESLPSDSRGSWVKGTKGNGVFEYADTPQNRSEGLAGKQVRFKDQHIARGGFPAESYYGGNAKSASVPIKEVKGSRADFRAADKAMRKKLNDPNWKRPAGYTWNHAGKPGSKTMELVETGIHSKVHHSGAASSARAATRAASLKGCTARSVGALTIYMSLRDAAIATGLTADQYEVTSEITFYFIAEDGSIYKVRERGFIGSIFASPYREYVAGPRKGETETITSDQAEAHRKAGEKVWGKYIRGNLINGPRFIPGTHRKTLPDVRDGFGRGYIDEEGAHKYPVYQGPMA